MLQDNGRDIPQLAYPADGVIADFAVLAEQPPFLLTQGGGLDQHLLRDVDFSQIVQICRVQQPPLLLGGEL